MNVVCVICSDLLIPSDDVFHTPCGHIFHFLCLSQWLERSKTCPQCREKTTNQKIHRIYFNFSNNDTVTEDASSLQDKVDKLNFQLLLRDKDIKHYKEKSESLEQQTVGLRNEVKKVELELKEKMTAIHAMKDQIKYFKEKCLEFDGTKEEIARLRKKVEEYKSIQTLMDAPAEEVDETMLRTVDPSTLITYISVMKREMTTCLHRRKELKVKARSLQQELTKVSMERNFLSEEHTMRKKLEEDLMVCETEKMSVENKLLLVESQLKSLGNREECNCICTKGDKPISSSPNQLKMDNAVTGEANNEKMIDDSKVGKDTVRKKNNEKEFVTVLEKDKAASAYLPVKSHGILAFSEHFGKRRAAIKLGSSVLARKQRIQEATTSSPSMHAASHVTYDGFGGHSKFDHFPIPISKRKRGITGDIIKMKKPKPDIRNNLKLGNFLN